ncbi:gamma-glutamylcyclotransferase [Alsobacter sp. SYSU M60028]|uniref:Gamma-glutamylcyclotransferase n=1 Tax=Alsobacter ponti TaxID=2962936 RepID=A0ABT1LC25_9HYPH|nr:gamma-glutamylcyclotransferase family protein [Alsobacter ponti]MCP8939019.1 gamma-glutamylcyclotransferase [Alsobacter ponti]
MPLYFAYGSNMDRAAMATRCPSARPLGVARLPRHRFLVTVDGYASVARDPRREVHGVVWDLALSDVPPLDRYESVQTGLYTKISQPVVMNGGAKRALIYVGRTDRPGKPKPGYLEAVLAAARSWELPESYLYEMEHGEPAPRRPGTPLFKAPM